MKYLIILLLLTAVACSEAEVECGAATYTFAAEVSPIIASSCSVRGCHTAGFAGGDFTTHAGLLPHINSGAFVSNIKSGSMPRGADLTEGEKQILVCWAEDGGVDN